MKIKTLLLAVCLLISSVPAEAKSLFDEPDKDAESALTVKVDQDRTLTEKQNLKNVEPQRDYQQRRIDNIENELRRVNSRLDALEAASRDSQKSQ